MNSDAEYLITSPTITGSETDVRLASDDFIPASEIGSNGKFPGSNITTDPNVKDMATRPQRDTTSGPEHWTIDLINEFGIDDAGLQTRLVDVEVARDDERVEVVIRRDTETWIVEGNDYGAELTARYDSEGPLTMVSKAPEWLDLVCARVGVDDVEVGR